MFTVLKPRRCLTALVRSIAVGALLALFALPLASLPASAAATATVPKSVAMLGVFFQNDNEGYEPTSDAEKHA